MAKTITRADYDAFANKLANAILDKQELKATATGGVSLTGKKIENYTDAQAEEISANLVNTLLAMRDGKEATKIKKLDKFVTKFQDDVEAFKAVLKGPSAVPQDVYEYALDRALNDILLMPKYVMNFENNQAVEMAMDMNFGLMASYHGKAMPLEGIDHIQAFQESLVRNHDRFIGPKEDLILPTLAWKDIPKKDRTQEFRTAQYDAVMQDIQQFLAEQSELRAIQAMEEAERAATAPAPDDLEVEDADFSPPLSGATPNIPPPVGFEAIADEAARENGLRVISHTVTDVPQKKSRVPDDEEVLPTLPELPRAKLVARHAEPKKLDFPFVSFVPDDDYPTLKS